MPSAEKATSGAKHLGSSPRGAGIAVCVQLPPPFCETCSAHEKLGVSILLETARFWDCAGLRTSVGELWALMSSASRAETLTGWSARASRTVGSSSKAPEITTAPTPTSSRETAARTANREPRRSSRSGPFAVGLWGRRRALRFRRPRRRCCHLPRVRLACRAAARRGQEERSGEAEDSHPDDAEPEEDASTGLRARLGLSGRDRGGSRRCDSAPQISCGRRRDTAALAGDLAAAFFVAALLLVPALAEAGAVELENTRCVP